MNLEFVAAMLTAVGLGGPAIYQAGVLRGRFDRHETTVEKRLDNLEDLSGTRVTREELDARFGAISDQLRSIQRALEQLTTR